MDTLKTTVIGICFGSLFLFPACGGFDVGLDDDAQEALECLTGDRCDDEDSGDTAEAEDDDGEDSEDDDGDESEDSDDAEDTGDSEDSGEEIEGETVSSGSFAGSSEDDSDTGGGFILGEPDGYAESDDRYFMGTYENYNDDNPDCAYDYNFPNVVRPYSHNGDDFIDFETNTGDLVWIAEQYPDDTFDFSVRFLDLFGDPSVRLDCTCTITEAYYFYYNDRIVCSCEGDDGVCTLGYEKM